MGEVHKANDQRFGRIVAINFEAQFERGLVEFKFEPQKMLHPGQLAL